MAFLIGGIWKNEDFFLKLRFLISTFNETFQMEINNLCLLLPLTLLAFLKDRSMM